MVLSMDRWVGKVAIVTGASSGIGAAIAEKLVNEGLKVAALARRKDRLEELAAKLSSQNGELYPIQADLTKEEEILAAFEWTTQNVGPIHILINNAGVGKRGLLTESPTENWNSIMQVNVIGLCIATREAIKIMKANDIDGHIVHINSVMGHNVYDVPGTNLYPASKHAVTALTEGLRMELSNLGVRIKITSVSPGLVDTEILGDFKNTSDYDELIDRRSILESSDVAEAVVYVLSTPPHVQVHELMLRAVGEIMRK